MLPSILYINICICEHISLSFCILCLRFNFWKRSRLGGGGGVDVSSLLGVCGAMQNCQSEPKIHLAREDKGGRRKDGDMRKGKNEHENENRDCGGMQRWSGGCSFAQCTVLCSPFPSSRHHLEHEHFFNHSRKSGVEDACHTAPSARITHTPLATLPCHTAPCLQLSTHHHLSLFPCSFPLLCSPYPFPA